MEDRSLMWDSRRVNDFVAIAAAMLVVVLIMLRGVAARGYSELLWVTPVMAVLAYVVTAGRRHWPLFVGAGGLVLATALGWILAQVMGAPWSVDRLAMIGLLAAWAPWPTLHNRSALLVLWALAWAPLVMLLVGPPVGTLSWAEALVTGERLEGLTGWNEVGIPAGVAALSALALRLQRDTWLRYGLVCVGLVLLAGAGTRSMMPGIVVAGVLWFLYRQRVVPWRGLVVEAVPWLLFLVVAIRPALLRTVQAMESGINVATNNRGSIISEYWAHAQQVLWTGGGQGTTDQLLRTGQVDVAYLPHNGFLTLVLDVGVPGMVVAVLGFTALAVYRSLEITGPARWLLRVPLLVFLPMLFLVDHGLWKALLIVPIMLFASAAPWVAEQVTGDEEQWRAHSGSTPPEATGTGVR